MVILTKKNYNDVLNVLTCGGRNIYAVVEGAPSSLLVFRCCETPCEIVSWKEPVTEDAFIKSGAVVSVSGLMW